MPSATVNASNKETGFLAALAHHSDAIRHSPALGMNGPRQ